MAKVVITGKLLDKLAAKARKARKHWKGRAVVVSDSRPDIFTADDKGGYLDGGHLLTQAKMPDYSQTVAEFVAACDPETVLALIETLRNFQSIPESL